MHTQHCFMQQCNEGVVEVHVGQDLQKEDRMQQSAISPYFNHKRCYRYTIFFIVGAYTKIKILLPLSSPWAKPLALRNVYKDSWIMGTASEYDQFCNQQQHEGK